MSAIKILSEDDAAESGHQLVPVTGEIDTIPHGVVWEMNDDQFAAYAAQFSTAQCAAMIRESHQQCLAYFKRGAEWYYVAGRWLSWAKAKKLHEAYGGWEVFCKDECKISPSQAWKYTEFADRFKPEQIESFDGERFSLERALGYESPAKEKKTASKAATTRPKEKKTGSKAAGSKPATKAKQRDNEEEGKKPDESEKPEREEEQPRPEQEGAEEKAEEGTENDQSGPEKPNEWGFSEGTKTAVVLRIPGQFVIQLSEDDEFFQLNLNRRQIQHLYKQIEKGLDKDDEYKPDTLPE